MREWRLRLRILQVCYRGWLAAVLLLDEAWERRACAQSLHAGTLKGRVTDPGEGAVPSAVIELTNAISGYRREVRSDGMGAFVMEGVPYNRYTLRVSAAGFEGERRGVEIRATVPVEVSVRLALAGQRTTVTVEEREGAEVDRVPVASQTVDRLTLGTLPAVAPGSGLNEAITLTAPNVAADSNGFFHPLGDHAQVSYVVDGQPITDQRNKVFSTSIPANAIQSMELISGSPAAEYGDKTSLVVNATTRSGLGQKPAGSLLVSYGSFGTIGEEATLGVGTARWGNFLVVNGERSGRFLDSPEFRPLHDRGNSGTVFDRVDYQPDGKQVLHVNGMVARNWMQIPNTLDQRRQDQRQKVISMNLAPGYQRTVDARTLATVNGFYRRDTVDYYPSRNVTDDAPATLGQRRTLENYGVRGDVSRLAGGHNLKAGLNVSQTRLKEAFTLGITDPGYNAPCLDGRGDGVAEVGLRGVSECVGAGYRGNPDFLPGLAGYDLSRGGRPYQFEGQATISQAAWFGQNVMTMGNLTVSLGLRYDAYNGLTRGGGAQPRGAFSYLIKRTKTVVRGGYSHTLETPVTENLVVSSSTGAGGLASTLFGEGAKEEPIALGSRNQYDAGIQQGVGRWVVMDVSYFRKYTRNAYDFDTLFNTPLTFPIGWKQSKLDGVGARVSTAEMKGWRAYATFGHANARFFGPETGGLVFNSNLAVGAYRQDHDQVYQHNVNVRYQRKKSGWWGDVTWRYDSGLVVGAVNGLGDALGLTAAQQAAIGFWCGGQRATAGNRITVCSGSSYGAERIRIPAAGTQNDDHNPPRTTPRNLLHVGMGTDNLFRGDRVRTVVRFTVVNLTNEASLYNFLSPFSGTHWYAPRTFQGQIGVAF